MVFIEDTRNKVGKHENINEYLKSKGHSVIRGKLLVGDYTTNFQVCVDTKKDILELVNNFCSQDHERVRNEIKLANNLNLQLVFLIEELPPYSNLNQWSSTKTKVSGETLLKVLQTTADKYGVTFRFCDKKDSGRVLEEILGERNG